MSSEWATFIFLLLVIIATLDIIRRAFMTMRWDRQARRDQKAMRRLKHAKKPWVTVLIYADGRDDALKTTLQSVRRSSYEHFDSIVVEATGVKKRAAYKAAYRNSKKGKVVVLLTAGERIDRSALKRAVATRHGRARWRVSVQSQQQGRPGIIGLVTQLQVLIWHPKVTVEACTPQALRAGNVRPTLGVREDMAVLASLALGFAVLLSAYAGGILVWYVWLVFSGYVIALILLQGGAFAHTGKLFASIPSALFLIPITAFFKEISQLSTRK